MFQRFDGTGTPTRLLHGKIHLNHLTWANWCHRTSELSHCSHDQKATSRCVVSPRLAPNASRSVRAPSIGSTWSDRAPQELHASDGCAALQPWAAALEEKRRSGAAWEKKSLVFFGVKSLGRSHERMKLMCKDCKDVDFVH